MLVLLTTCNDDGSARPSVSTTNLKRTRPGTPSIPGGVICAPADTSCGGSSASAADTTTLPTSTGPVPPITPVATPPSTPLPVKSRGSNGFWFRSTGGMSFGMSVGAMTV